MELGLAGAELIDGVVRRQPVPGAKHGAVAGNIVFALTSWARDGARGWVLVEVDYLVDRSPDRIRRADVSFISADRLAEPTDGYCETRPDLAVEVVSPNESATELEEKLEDYRKLEVPMLWVAYPNTRTVVAHTADGLARILRGDDILRGGDVLPGFECPIRDFFTL